MEYDRAKAADYDRLRPHQGERFRFWVDRLVELSGVQRDHSILDIGCGTGRYTLPLHEVGGARTVGLDRSKAMLAEARRKSRKIEWMQGEALELPFGARSFDRAYMVYVIHQIEQKERALAEACRVLKKGGRLTVLTTSFYSFRRNPMIKDFPGAIRIEEERFPKIPELMEMVEDAGFSVKRYVRGPGVERIPLEEFLAWIRAKSVSTFHLMDEEVFERGFEVFERRLRARGEIVERDYRATFVVGDKL